MAFRIEGMMKDSQLHLLRNDSWTNLVVMTLLEKGKKERSEAKRGRIYNHR